MTDSPLRFSGRHQKTIRAAGSASVRAISLSWLQRAVRALNIPASTRICDKMGARRHIPMKYLADLNGSHYKNTGWNTLEKLLCGRKALFDFPSR